MNFRRISSDIVLVSWSLFKVMVPTLILVKAAQEIGLVDFLNFVLDPITELIGLPNELTIVLTTTILTNPYAGLIVLASIGIPNNFSIAESTILASFMLFTHAMPVELAISRNAGAKAIFLIFLRLFTAIIFCFLIHKVCTYFNLLQNLATLSLIQFHQTSSLFGWVIEQIRGLIFIQVVIIALLLLLEVLKFLGVERLVSYLMAPFLKFLGIGKNASTIIVVGLTIGLGFGGGLMIKEVKQGKVNKKDAVNALIFINLFHSIIEDNSLVMLLGPSLVIVLFVRAVFVFFCVYLVIFLLDKLPSSVFNRLILNSRPFIN